MEKPFKYTTSFAGEIYVKNLEEQDVSIASNLESLRKIIPKDIDFKKNIDLMAVAFNAAVANLFNKNGDGIDGQTAKAISEYFIHKPTNIEHKRDNVVGHITGSSFSKFGSNEIIESFSEIDEDEPFNIALSAIVYKSVNPDFAELVEKSTDKSSELYQKISASWELGFNDFDIAKGSEELSRSIIIEDEKEKAELSKHLKCYGGSGKTENGESVFRLIKGDIYPLGIGFTSNPAATVQGVINAEEHSSAISLEEENLSFEKIEINPQKISQTEKDNVQPYNIKNSKSNMEQEILDQFKSVLEETKASKKLSEEAVANMTKVFHDAIVERSEQWQSEKEQLLAQKAELEKVSESTAEEISELKSQLAETSEKLEALETEAAAKEAVEVFNSRMSEIDELYHLEEDDRKILAEELRSLETEASYEGYKEKLSIFWKSKNKEFMAEQEKAIEERIQAAVQAQLSKDTATEEVAEASEAEVVEEAIESAEVEEEAISNNNGGSTEEELSLREKFLKAFSEDSVTIKY
jgi:hypothetical protein